MEEIGPALLLAVAGYLTLRHCSNRTKFRWAALDWNQNVFESAAVGAALFGVVRLLWTLRPPFAWMAAMIHPVISAANAAAAAIHDALPFHFSGSLLAAYFLGIGGGYFSNLWWRAEAEVRRAVRNHGGDLRIFLHEAAAAGWPVSVTMKNKKVYVGLVLVPPGLEEPCYVTLLPTLSGYRDSNTLRLVFTTAYEHVYEDLRRRRAVEPGTLDRNDFAIVLPLANVDSANRYDNDVFRRYFADTPRGPSPELPQPGPAVVPGPVPKKT